MYRFGSLEVFLISPKNERKWIRETMKENSSNTFFNQTTLLLQSLLKPLQDAKIWWSLNNYYTKPSSNECKCRLFVNSQLHLTVGVSINEDVSSRNHPLMPLKNSKNK